MEEIKFNIEEISKNIDFLDLLPIEKIAVQNKLTDINAHNHKINLELKEIEKIVNEINKIILNE